MPHSHCTTCGTAWPDLASAWPRTCSECRHSTWRNPVPVMVLLVPLADYPGQVLGVRRGIPPSVGGLALPGGYLESGETWREGAVRELREETGLVVNPHMVEHIAVESTPRNPDVLLVFGHVLVPQTFPHAFIPNEEVTSVEPVGLETMLAFPTHQEVARKYLRHPRWGARG